MNQRMIEISKLLDEDRGMRVAYVPAHAQRDGERGWLGNYDSMWGNISGWDATLIHVSYDRLKATQLCEPAELFPEHLSKYAKRKKKDG